MEIADVVRVGLVYLADAFGLDDFVQRLAIDLGVERQLYRVDDILVEFPQADVCAVQFDCLPYVVEYRPVVNEILIGNLSYFLF